VAPDVRRRHRGRATRPESARAFAAPAQGGDLSREASAATARVVEDHVRGDVNGFDDAVSAGPTLLNVNDFRAAIIAAPQ